MGNAAAAKRFPGPALGDAIAVDGDGIDLLAMDAYGHSRIRNLIIGSTTPKWFGCAGFRSSCSADTSRAAIPGCTYSEERDEMILEMAEGASPELAQGLGFASLRIRNGGRRILRHGLVHGLMPLINFLSTRFFMQHRPERYAGRTGEIRRLQHLWESGRRGNNRSDYARLYLLIANLEAVLEAGVPGAIAELGVYKGNSARVIHELAPERDLYLFDTFEGFPVAHTANDPSLVGAGHYASGLEQVRQFVGDSARIRYCQGMFPGTATGLPPGLSFAMVHLDCDLYAPTRAGLEFFYPRLSPGGLLLLHDYWSNSWPGVTLAVDEFLADKTEGLVRMPDKSGSAILIKARSARAA